MGSASSKFKKYLQHGDEYAAMQVRSFNYVRNALIAHLFDGFKGIPKLTWAEEASGP